MKRTMDHLRRRPATRLFLGLYMVLVMVLSLTPARVYPDVAITFSDLIVHFLMYAGLAYLAARTFGTCPVRWRRVSLWLFVLLFAFGYWMEFLQGLFTGLNRSASFADALANGAGVAAGILLRLRRSYRTCRCRHAAACGVCPPPEGYVPAGGMEMIGHNPVIPAIIQQVFGWKPLAVAGKGIHAGAVCTGRGFVSLPHFPAGDVWHDPGTGMPEAAAVLLHTTKEQNRPAPELRFAGTAPGGASGKVLTCMPLEKDPWERYPSNLRRKIRKAHHNGFTTEAGGMELLNDFYGIYARHLRTLGSAGLTRRWFAALLRQYTGGHCGILLLKKEGRTVGAAFNLGYKGFYENAYFAVLKPYQRQYGSYALCSALVAEARALGCHTFSFGQSTAGSGVHRFKHQWNTFDIPLAWLKPGGGSPGLRGHRWLHRVWKRVPWPLGKTVDRYVAKWVY